MLTRSFVLWISTWGLSHQAAAQNPTFEFLERRSFALDELSSEEVSQFKAETALVFFDGSISSSPPDRTSYDRQLSSISDLGLRWALGSHWRLDIHNNAMVHYRKRLPAVEPVIEQITLNGSGYSDLKLSYHGSDQLVLFGGYSYFHFSPYEETLETPLLSSRTTFDRAEAGSYFVGAIKKLPIASVGFFYRASQTYSLGYQRFQNDESTPFTSGEERQLIPSTVGMVAALSLWSGQSKVEFASVAAGEDGPRRSNGQPIQDDYLRMRWDWKSNSALVDGYKIWLHGFYRTLSYASNQDVSLQMIPLGALHAGIWAGGMDLPLEWGAFVYLLYGWDRQSIPEFNADYQWAAIGGRLAMRWRF